jgi:hypothetical protein
MIFHIALVSILIVNSFLLLGVAGALSTLVDYTLQIPKPDVIVDGWSVLEAGDEVLLHFPDALSSVWAVEAIHANGSISMLPATNTEGKT